MSNLYQDAILDAKALRASAMANAKAALEEAFEPKIQEMISKHLSEEEGIEEEIEEGYDLEEEGYDKQEEGAMDGQNADINEAELEEILNQLEEIDSANESLNEAEEDEEENEEEEESDEEETEEGEEEEGEEGEDEGDVEGEGVTDETKVIEITVGDLKQILQSVMPATADTTTPEPEGPEADDEAEVSLEEILDELENEGMEDPANYSGGIQAGTKEEGAYQMEEASKKIPTPKEGPFTVAVRKDGKTSEMDFPTEEKAKSDAKSKIAKGVDVYISGPNGRHYLQSEDGGELESRRINESELQEAKATIEALRKDLQEVNLLNAKYLYMNKLFKSKSLTESEKVKVINALDRATNVKEVKLTYQTLSESFEKKKQTIKESIGFASKPAGVAPKANIMEADQFISRWQKLAGIK